MESKNLVFLIALICGAYSLVMSGFVLLDKVGDLQEGVHSELQRDALPTAFEQGINTSDEVIFALNFALPVGVVCLGLLIYLKRTNSVSMGLILLAAGVMTIASMVTWKAGQQLEEKGAAQMARDVWWN